MPLDRISQLDSGYHHFSKENRLFPIIDPADIFINYPESLYSTPVCSKFAFSAIIRGIIPRCLR